MKTRIVALVFGSSVVALASTFAIDLNNDGMSDVWEQKFSVPSNAAMEDSDGDGFTNLQESMLGTDPRDRLSSAKLEMIFDELQDELRLRINTAFGKLYEVETTTNLSTWTTVQSGIEGTGNSRDVITTFPPESVSAGFFRYRRSSEIDADADSLTAWEENELGTNDSSGDTDSDGMDDASEVGNGLNPLINDASFDLDGDGLTNSEEIEAGTKPNVPDTDGDGVLDGADGWALERDLSPPRLPAASYAIVRIEADEAIDLNDSGSMLIRRGDEYLVWKPNSITSIQAPANYYVQSATCINASGVVAGVVGTDTERENTSGDPPVTTPVWSERPFKWSEGGMMLLNNFISTDRWSWDPNYAWVWAMNDAGVVVGEGSLTVNDIHGASLIVGAIWQGADPSPVTSIPDANDYDDRTIVGGRYRFINAGGLLDSVYAFDVNNSGLVVGKTLEEDRLWSSSGGRTQHRVIWEDPALPPHDLGTDASPVAVNDHGHVVGSVSTAGSPPTWTGALWLKKEGSWQRKLLDSGVPYAINDNVQLGSSGFIMGKGQAFRKRRGCGCDSFGRSGSRVRWP